MVTPLLLLLLLLPARGALATCEVDVRVPPGDCVLCADSPSLAVGDAAGATTVASSALWYEDDGQELNLLDRVSAFHQTAAQALVRSVDTSMTSNWATSVAGGQAVQSPAGTFTLSRPGWYRISAAVVLTFDTGGSNAEIDTRVNLVRNGAVLFASRYKATRVYINFGGVNFLHVVEVTTPATFQLSVLFSRVESEPATAQVASFAFEYLHP